MSMLKVFRYFQHNRVQTPIEQNSITGQRTTITTTTTTRKNKSNFSKLTSISQNHLIAAFQNWRKNIDMSQNPKS